MFYINVFRRDVNILFWKVRSDVGWLQIIMTRNIFLVLFVYLFFKGNSTKDWRDAPVKSTSCSFRGLRFNSWHWQGGSQLPVTLQNSSGTTYTCCLDMHAGKTPTYIINFLKRACVASCTQVIITWMMKQEGWRAWGLPGVHRKIISHEQKKNAIKEGGKHDIWSSVNLDGSGKWNLICGLFFVAHDCQQPQGQNNSNMW